MTDPNSVAGKVEAEEKEEETMEERDERVAAKEIEIFEERYDELVEVIVGRGDIDDEIRALAYEWAEDDIE